jgi:hypothetical protein
MHGGRSLAIGIWDGAIFLRLRAIKADGIPEA